MWLIVGLGNPGTQYSLNRHNIGFMAVDYLLRSLSEGSKSNRIHEKSEMKGQLAKFKWGDHDVVTLKPQTYMNKSGESVQSVMQFYKINSEHLIVIHDEIDQVFSKIKLQKNRGHAGHNGVRSITESLGTSDYIRLRLGVGRPIIPQQSVADFVLQNFTNEEFNAMPDFLNQACDSLESTVFKSTSIFDK